jgi:hypothetical protein
MANLQITTSLLGIGLAVFIIVLLRRDHIFILHGLFWMGVAVLAALLGLWPGLIDKVAGLVGISYPPAALLLGAVIVLFVKLLYSDITQTQLERQLRRLNQRVAMMDVTHPPGATDKLPVGLEAPPGHDPMQH